MASNRSLQLLRNNTVFGTLDLAKAAMSAATTQDGVAVLGRYTSGNEIKTVLGIQHAMSGGSGMTFFENSNETSELIQELQRELDATQAGAGLNADGTFKAPSGWTSESTTTLGAIQMIADEIEKMDADSVANENNVVTDVTQANGKITATSANLTGVKLSGYTVGDDDSGKVAATDTLGQALGKLQGQINGMDKAASAVAGQVVTTVTETDGKVTEDKANVKDLQLGGYAKTDATGPISGTDTINVALSKLENKANAITIANADGSINVTTAATGTDINVNIKSGENVIKKDGNGGGLYTNLSLVKITTGLPATVKESYEFRDSDGNKIGESIDIAKDSHIVSITYDETTQNLIYKYLDASGTEQTVKVDMTHLILETEVENGVQSVNGKLSIKLDTTGDDTGDGKFLTVGTNGLKLDGVTDAIAAAINALDVSGDTAVAGQYVAAIQEADGIVSVKSRANVSDAVLNGYEKGTKPASTAITATDDVKGAIAKLEHQIDDAKAAATTKVEKDANASHLTLSSSTASDGSVTYTIGESDVASKTALDTLSEKTVTVINGSDSDIDVMVSHVAADDGTVKYTISASGNATTIKVGEDLDGEDGALSADSTISQALAALYNTAKQNKVVGKQAIAVGAPTSGGTEVSLKLDEGKQGTGTEKSGTDNALTQSDGGLFLSTIWDCGTYN